MCMFRGAGVSEEGERFPILDMSDLNTSYADVFQNMGVLRLHLNKKTIFV